MPHSPIYWAHLPYSARVSRTRCWSFPTGKGGIFSSNILMDMKAAGTNPKAIVNTKAHPVWVALCIELGYPLVDRLDQDPVKVIETGDWVKVDAEKGTVEVTKK